MPIDQHIPSTLSLHTQVAEYKVNTQDVFERAKKMVDSIHSSIQTLEIQREEVGLAGPSPSLSAFPPSLSLRM